MKQDCENSNEQDEVAGALKELAAQVPADHAGWAHLLVLLNRAFAVEAVKRGVVHDARNNLHTIMMSARAVGDAPSDPTVSSRLIPLLVDAAGKLEEAFERLGRTGFGSILGPPVPVALRDTLDAAVAAVPASRRVYNPPISVDAQQKLPAVLAVENGLEHVLFNLIVNARDAMADRDSGEIRLSAVAEGDWVCISVTDEGPGIPATEASSIFEPFYTTRASEGRIGLGLTVADLLVRSWGGTVRVAEDAAHEGGSLVVRLCTADGFGSGGNSH